MLVTDTAVETVPVILHISDIQFGPSCVFDSKEQMLRKLTADISRFSSEKIPWPNIIVLAGDVIDKGTLDRYENALWFIRELAKFLRIPVTEFRHRIVVVPGNHDVKREIADHQPQYKLFAFERFCTELFGVEASPFSFDRGKNFAVSMIDGEHPLVFIALNSCERISSEVVEGYLSSAVAISAMRAAQEIAGGKPATYVAVFHHNAVALETNDRLVNFYTELKDIFVCGRVSLCLHGHIHNQHVEEFATSDVGRSLITIAAGSLGISANQRPSQMGLAVPNQYNVIRLDPQRQEGKLYVRQYRPELAPIDDQDFTRGRWQEYRVFKIGGSDSSRRVFSLRSRGYIAPAAFFYGVDARHDLEPKRKGGEQMSRLLGLMKPSQRLKEAVGSEVDSAVAVDDGLLFLRSDLQDGWRPQQIDLVFDLPFVLPYDLQQIAQRHRAELSLPNKTKYMIRKIVPPILDQTAGDTSVKIHLAPISYFDIRGIENALDEPVGVGEHPQNSLRQLYFKDHALFSEGSRLPNKVVIHILVVTKDQKFLLMRRSRFVEFQNYQWSATFEEQMQGDYLNEITGVKELGDEDFFATAVRGIREELGILVDRRAITLLGICSEYENLAYNVIGIAKVDLDSDDVGSGWKLHAPDKAESARLLFLPFEQDKVFELLQNESFSLPKYGIHGEPWHSTSRIRILLGALHYFR